MPIQCSTALILLPSPMLAAARKCLVGQSIYKRGIVRALSSSTLHPALLEFASTLKTKQPCLPVASEHVRVLAQPHDFYTSLLVGQLSIYSETALTSLLDYDAGCSQEDISVIIIHRLLGE